MKIKKTLLALSLFIAFEGLTSCNSSKYLKFEIVGEEAHVVGCSSVSHAKIVIPSKYDGYPVTTIEDYAFGQHELDSIVIPDSVVSIEKYAFSDCSNLTSVSLGEGLTYIGERAFDKCRKLTSITFPNSLEYIGDNAFYDSKFTQISIPNNVFYIGEDAFYKSSFEYKEYENGYYIGNEENPYLVLVKAKTDSAGYFKFHDDTKVMMDAFAECTNLTSVLLPNAIRSICTYAFNNCGLNSILIPNNITSIGKGAFQGCSSLASVYYTGTSTEWDNISIDSNFNDNLTSATRYYYSETQPTDTTYNYWHYVDGLPTAW